MKKTIIHIGIVAVLFMLGCDNTSFDCVKKAGDLTTITLALPPFHSININDGINVIIKTGNAQEVKLTAGENLLSGIKANVDNAGFLNIYNENSCNWVRSYKDINMHITLDTLHRVNHYGFGVLSSDGVLTFKNFHINLKDGAGDIRLAIDNQSLILISNSISNCYISGHTNNFTVGFYYNDGICWAQDLLARKVNVEHLGTNTIEVNALETLTGSLQSNGDIVYHGNPENIDINVTGTGELLQK